MTTVNVIGLGYIGLPTALIMAAHGLTVVGTDINERVVGPLREGTLTFEEEGLDALFRRARQGGITFSTSPVSADIYIIALPTPYDSASKKIDAGPVTAGTRAVVEVAPDDAIVVIESTISPGTIDTYVRPILLQAGARRGVRLHVCHAPERIIPGNMLHELEHNSRTIGADDPAVAGRVRDVYATFCTGQIVLTDVRSAEMSKVVENTFRDINIAFANELAVICRTAGLDVYEVIKLANMHPRVNILSPGPGVGGHCIPVDPWFLVGDYPDQAKLIHQARLTNDAMPAYVLERLRQEMANAGLPPDARIGIYGISYKEDVDDIRESPTLQLLEVIEREQGQQPLCYDPHVGPGVVPHQATSFDSFVESVDVVVIMTGHRQIRDDSGRLASKLVLDTRHCVTGPNVVSL